MTDEERRVLCAKLRDGSLRNMPKWAYGACSEAADEIERLAEEVEEWKQPLGFRTNDVPDPYAEGRGDFAKYAEQFNKELVWKLRSGAATFIEKMAADEIARLNDDVKALRQQIEHYHGRWGKRDD
jgi:HAMP domain-containing protein